MMSSTHREERIGSRYLGRIIFVLLSVLFLFSGVMLWNVVTALPSERTTIVIAGDPVYVQSWDEARLTLTVIPVPVDVYLEGVYGVGSLSVASLQKLEALDAKKEGLFVKSVENTLALPIVGEWSGLSPALRFRLWWIRKWLRPDTVKIIDLESEGVIRNDVLADGSGIRAFDIHRYDAVIGNRLEVDNIRREEFRIRVVNTTDVQGLGNRAARFLSLAGMVVVAVDSEATAQNECTVNTIWATISVGFIRRAFNCATMTTDLDERANVTVRLGKDYAKGFTTSD